MGNREDLLAGAQRCLLEKGYERTTARDIANASGVSLAAIGYHFGSKEALLNEALFAAMDEWGATVDRALTADGEAADATTIGRVEAQMDRMVGTLVEHRPLWIASFEAFLLAVRNPKMREMMSMGHQEGRRGLAAQLRGVPEDTVSDEEARTFGGVALALISGMLMQQLIDPDHAPSGADVVAGLRTLARYADESTPAAASSTDEG